MKLYFEMYCQKYVSVHVLTWYEAKTNNSKFELLILRLKIMSFQ